MSVLCPVTRPRTTSSAGLRQEWPREVVWSSLDTCHSSYYQSLFVPLTALYTFLPLLATVSINCLISTSLLCRERRGEEAGCAGCRLEGGVCQHHLDWRVITRDKARLDRLVKMKTVRRTVFTALGFLLCQVLKPFLSVQTFSDSQIPTSIIWLIAWDSSSKDELNINPILIEVFMATRFLYIVIVPVLHGSVLENDPRRVSATFKSSPPFCITKFS